MNAHRRAVEKALAKYDLAAEKTAALALDVLSTTARMVAVDMDRDISFVTGGFLITREPKVVGDRS
jgi:uncharacterized protein GlcG (DUF336 family)